MDTKYSSTERHIVDKLLQHHFKWFSYSWIL